MKIRWISRYGDCLALAQRMADEGHDVSVALLDVPKHMGEGLVEHVDPWNAGLDEPTIILFDAPGRGRMAEGLAKQGHAVFGSSPLADSLETPTFGRQVAQSCGILIDDDADGIPINLECWYVQGRPCPSTQSASLELTRLFPGDLGPETNPISAITWFWRNPGNKLYAMTLSRIEDFLGRFGFTGPLTMKLVVRERDKRPVFRGFAGSLQLPATHARMADINISVAEWFAAPAQGNTVTVSPTYEYCGALRITVPPYPYPGAALDLPPRPVSGKLLPLDVRVQDGQMMTGGIDGVLGDVIACHCDVQGLCAALYEAAKAVQVADKQYRADVADDAERRLGTLHEWKYC